MQFVEKSAFGVRTVIYRLKRSGGGPDFILFPMLHVGTQSYYDGIARRLADCDAILYEGLRSRRSWALTLSYRVMPYLQDEDLVTQGEGLPLAQFGAKLIHADLDGRDFDAQ